MNSGEEENLTSQSVDTEVLYTESHFVMLLRNVQQKLLELQLENERLQKRVRMLLLMR